MNENNDTASFCAKAIIDQCIACGITNFFIAPGARSSMLALAVAHCSLAQAHLFFDERSLAFQALGFAKGSTSTPAVIVTSGTAAGNLLPAIMESDASGIPMLILTADRPWELRSCGANQTTDQVKMFHSYVRWHMDVPCTEKNLIGPPLSSLICFAAFKAQGYHPGPVHLNIMFREPLVVAESPPKLITSSTTYMIGKSSLSNDDLEKLAFLLSKLSGIIFITTPTDPADKAAIFQLANALSWPVIEDITARDGCKSSQTIAYFDLMLKANVPLNPSCILQFGERITSKGISSWIKDLCCCYVVVSPSPIRVDPEATVTHRIVASISTTAQSLAALCSASGEKISSQLQDLASKLQPCMQTLSCSKEITEPSLFLWLSHHISQGWDLFIGNSMPIRDGDMFFFPKDFDGRVFTSRGLSGIDGNVSMCYGIACARRRPLVAVVGDLTFLHDMSACLQLGKAPFPIVIIVINNQGGGIFSFLPMAKEQKHFERFLATSHSWQMQPVSSLANLSYEKPTTMQELQLLWQKIKMQPTSCIIELTTERKQNHDLHQTIYQTIQNTLCSTSLATAETQSHTLSFFTAS